MMNRKSLVKVVLRRALVLALLVAALCAQVVGQRRERLVDAWRPVHYDITLRLDDQLTQLASARAALDIEVLKGPLATIDLDFGELTVDSVTVGDAPSRFERAAGRLNVLLPQPAAAGAKL